MAQRLSRISRAWILIVFALTSVLVVVLTVGLLDGGLLRVKAQDEPALSTPEPHNGAMSVDADELITLTVDGAAARDVSHDGVLARFMISVLDKSVLTAASTGNKATAAIAAAIEQQCTTDEPENADHTAAPTCISPNGLQTTSIRISEEFDWTEQGRVSQGFRYENQLRIAIRGTGFAGGLVDLVIRAGGDDVRFGGIDFTASRRAEAERLALLDAIDDANSTAASIVKHMGYEIVRVVEIRPISDVSATRANGFVAEAMADDSSYTPTQLHSGSEQVTASVQIVYALDAASAGTN